MLTLACVWMRGRGKRQYGVEYVERLRSMVGRHLDRPFRTVCLTDRPGDVPKGVEAVPAVTPFRLTPWWVKLRLFDPTMPFDERVLYVDLDVLVVSDLAPVVDWPADFVLCPDSAPTWLGKGRRRAVKRYNSSVMVFDRGARPDLWRDWRPKVGERLWSDQDWIGEQCPNEATFPARWFRRVNESDPPPWPDETKVVLCIGTKNHQAVGKWPWVADLWR